MGNPNMQVGKPSVNPKGRPSGIIHTLNDRQSRFLETLTRGEILALAADKERLDREYKAFDAQVIMGLAETLMDTPADKLDPMKAREHLYDRNLGKPTNKTELTGKDGDAIEIRPVAAIVDRLPSNVRQELISSIRKELAKD